MHSEGPNKPYIPELHAKETETPLERVLSQYKTNKSTGIVTPELADRDNAGKPKLSYILTFEGVFDEAHTLYDLHRWYVGKGDIGPVVSRILETVIEPFTGIAKVAEFGESKYARGNYLKGRPWSDTCDSLLRHFFATGNDSDSGLPHRWHMAWNAVFLQHCVLTMPELDDRIRP